MWDIFKKKSKLAAGQQLVDKHFKDTVVEVVELSPDGKAVRIKHLSHNGLFSTGPGSISQHSIDFLNTLYEPCKDS